MKNYEVKFALVYGAIYVRIEARAPAGRHLSPHLTQRPTRTPFSPCTDPGSAGPNVAEYAPLLLGGSWRKQEAARVLAACCCPCFFCFFFFTVGISPARCRARVRVWSSHPPNQLVHESGVEFTGPPSISAVIRRGGEPGAVPHLSLFFKS